MSLTNMQGAPLHGGWFRHLTHGDEPALLAHHLRLSADDLRTRFLHMVGEGYLAQHARKVHEPDYHVIGWFHQGTLRGVAEISTEGSGEATGSDGSAAEAAFSVEGPWRNRGIGRALMRRALRRARLSGCTSMTVHTSGDNLPMIRVARAFGARISIRDGEVIGELTPTAATLAEMSFDLVEDRIGLLAAGGELALSLLSAGWPTRCRPA